MCSRNRPFPVVFDRDPSCSRSYPYRIRFISTRIRSGYGVFRMNSDHRNCREVRGSGTALSVPEYCFHVPHVFPVVSGGKYMGTGGNGPEKTPFPAGSCWSRRPESSAWGVISKETPLTICPNLDHFHSNFFH